jgi:hypothetical protein
MKTTDAGEFVLQGRNNVTEWISALPGGAADNATGAACVFSGVVSPWGTALSRAPHLVLTTPGLSVD